MEYKLDLTDMQDVEWIVPTEEETLASCYSSQVTRNREMLHIKYESGSLEDQVKAVNRCFARFRAKMAEEMTDYLIRHQGKVGRWPIPGTALGIKSLQEGMTYYFDYFAGDFAVDAEGKVARPEKSVFHDAFRLPEGGNLERLLACWREEHGKPLREAEERVDRCASEAVGVAPTFTGRLWALFGILLFLCVAVAVAAPCVVFWTRPDWNYGGWLWDVADYFYLERVDWGFARYVPLVLWTVLAIPSNIIWRVGVIFSQAAALRVIWTIITAIALIFVYVIALAIFDMGCLFRRKNGKEQQALQWAITERDKARQRYEEEEEEFRKSGEYEEAAALDRKAEEWKKNEAALRAFVLNWQRAWFEATAREADETRRLLDGMVDGRITPEQMRSAEHPEKPAFEMARRPEIRPEVTGRQKASPEVSHYIDLAADAEAAGDLAATFRYVKEAADRGNVACMYQVGSRYLHGQGVRENDQEALRYAEMAAEHGHVNGQALSGLLYLEGTGTTQDPKKAAYWLLRAAKQGDTTAMDTLGNLYTEGRGVERDYAQALMWLDFAAELGNEEAQFDLALYYIHAPGALGGDMEKGRELMRQYAAAGNRRAKAYFK